ncbi:hypothetical protein BDR07DRAFT_1425962, partial [Suillus spraguei]
IQINMRRQLCASKNAAGQTVTSETALQLPLTYYGPSIPLGSDGAWTYGGSPRQQLPLPLQRLLLPRHPPPSPQHHPL